MIINIYYLINLTLNKISFQMNNTDGMTTPANCSSQDNPRYLSSNMPLRNFSLKEIEENNLEIIEDEPQYTESEMKDKLERILGETKDYNIQAMIVDESEDDNLIEDNADQDEEMINDDNADGNGDTGDNAENTQQLNSQIKESHKKERISFSRFPMSKIKNIMKLDDDVKLCQKNAYFVVCKLTELFLKELAQNAHSVAKLNKRKTMNLEDIACAVKSSEKYSFIDVNTIFTVETVDDLKMKEEKFEKKMKQIEIKSDKKDKKEPKIEKINKKNIQQPNNMRIDKMFFARQERDSEN